MASVIGALGIVRPGSGPCDLSHGFAQDASRGNFREGPQTWGTGLLRLGNGLTGTGGTLRC